MGFLVPLAIGATVAGVGAYAANRQASTARANAQAQAQFEQSQNQWNLNEQNFEQQWRVNQTALENQFNAEQSRRIQEDTRRAIQNANRRISDQNNQFMDAMNRSQLEFLKQQQITRQQYAASQMAIEKPITENRIPDPKTANDLLYGRGTIYTSPLGDTSDPTIGRTRLLGN